MDTSQRRWWVAAAASTLLAVVVLWPVVWAQLDGPGAGKRHVLVVPADAGSAEIAELAAGAGLVESPRLFTFYLRLLPAFEAVPGAHVLNDGLSPSELADRLARDPGRQRVKVTIPEGWNHRQIAARLEQSEVCVAREFRRAIADAALLQKTGIRGPSAEGYLFPATYRLAVDSPPEDIIERLVRETRKRIDKLAEQHAPHDRTDALKELRERRGWGEHELLTMASIIEKETAHPGERPLIAGVFYNRLDSEDFKPRGRLQSDPTAGYGCLVEPKRATSCAGYAGRITPEMLRDSSNRYNTYRHAGLPPGPIANPGEAAISAVLAPKQSDFFFFVADGSGKHRFSRTPGEHEAAVRAAP